MNTFMTNLLGPSWRTTLGGALVGFPPIVYGAAQGAGISFGHWTLFALAMIAGLGGLILGTNAKDAQVHSTQAQVQASTVEAVQISKPIVAGTP
jgi:hypothetical protein